MGLYIKELNIDGYEKVIHAECSETGLHAFIAVHDISSGPALGGTRMIPYRCEEEALRDVLLLAEGMTYKSVMAGLPCGGGKSVIAIRPEIGKTPALLRAFGEVLNYLNGIYICAEDMGCTPEDLEIIRSVSPHVLGLNEGSGDPSRFTARGVFRGIESSAAYLWGSSSLKGKTVLIQGVGSVGEKLAEHLFWAGASLLIADTDPAKTARIAHEYGARIIPLEEVYATPCDIFAPCAGGGILNKTTIPSLSCHLVAGGANNQLGEKADARRLAEKGILYAPDYVINCGGVISVASDFDRKNITPAVIRDKTELVYSRLPEIYERATQEGLTTAQAADQMVIETLTKIQNEKNAIA